MLLSAVCDKAHATTAVDADLRGTLRSLGAGLCHWALHVSTAPASYLLALKVCQLDGLVSVEPCILT